MGETYTLAYFYFFKLITKFWAELSPECSYKELWQQKTTEEEESADWNSYPVVDWFKQHTSSVSDKMDNK